MVDSVTAVAPAKINLCLGVGPRRPDGFHSLATVYQAVDLHDTVTVAAARSGSTSVRVHGTAARYVPTGPSNIVVRAAELLRSGRDLQPVQITIDKQIPVAGGLAGGSADAAATLVACDAWWRLGMPHEELLGLAGRLGSDVPFALLGGTAIGTGHGELVTPVETGGEFWWVLRTFEEGLSTPAVYAEFDRLQDEVAEPSVPEALLKALREGDAAALGDALSNDLHAATFSLRPSLREALDEEGVLGALVSGSGPTVLFLCASREHAGRVAGRRTGGLLARGPVAGATVVG